MLGGEGVKRADEARQHVVQITPEDVDVGVRQGGGEGIVGRLDAGGHHQAPQAPRAAQAFDLAQDHGLAAQRGQHLARQAGGAHPGLEDRKRAHGS